MKITVELDEFWMHDEQDLSTELKEYVKNKVLKEVSDYIKNKVDTQITMQVKEEVEKHMYKQINEFIANTISTGKVKGLVSPYELVSLEEFIKQKFEKETGWNSFDSKIKEIAQKHATDMKSRYDLLFASQLVAKMSENGLLKKDAAKLLLDKQ